MILESGNMWDVFGKGDLWLFTGNSYITKGHELVMGRGLALEVKTRWPYLPGQLAKWMLKTCGHLGVYGVEVGVGVKAGVFQVKRHFRDKAELALIGYSVLKLEDLIKKRGVKRVDLNFPGIGYGRLARESVLPIVSELPDVVHIWERGK